MSLFNLFQNKKKKYKARKSFLLTEDAPFELVEAFRNLKASISVSIAKEMGQKGITLLTTSSRPAEGKTTVAVNLALTLSRSQEKVLLIDADVRKGRVAIYFKEQAKPGLTDYLAGQATLEEVTRASKISENLFYIPCGSRTPRPYELIESGEMKRLIGAVKEKYDYIVIDTPPALMIPDALALVKEVDGTIVVCRHRESIVSEISKTIGTLTFAQAKILGVVVNDFYSKEKRSSAYGEYYKVTVPKEQDA